MPDIQYLQNISKKIRIDVVKSLAEAGSGHLGGSLGLADVFTALYFHILKHDPKKPNWPERDRLVLSIGHVAPVLYAALAHSGYFPVEELLTLRKFGSRLQGHPGIDHGLPGLELSSGSLGQGLSIAVGLALAAKMDKKNWRVYSVHGDGELQEGSVWEAAMSAGHHKLDNLISFIDRNFVQIDGKTSEVMELEPLKDKLISFGWKVLNCNGNNIAEIIETWQKAKQFTGKPVAIIANTKMSKAISSIEGDHQWHAKVPSKEEKEDFISQIEQYYQDLHKNIS